MVVLLVQKSIVAELFYLQPARYDASDREGLKMQYHATKSNVFF